VLFKEIDSLRFAVLHDHKVLRMQPLDRFVVPFCHYNIDDNLARMSSVDWRSGLAGGRRAAGSQSWGSDKTQKKAEERNAALAHRYLRDAQL
jgi:hypothetical protein